MHTIVSKKFWSHVVRRSTFGLWLVNQIRFVLCLRRIEIYKLAGKPEITKFESTILVQQHIGWFKIAVDNTVGMQIVQSLRQISSKLFHSIFGQLFVLFNQLEQIATGTIFKNDPEMVPRFIPVKKLEYVSVFKIVEDSDFVQNLFASVFLY